MKRIVLCLVLVSIFALTGCSNLNKNVPIGENNTKKKTDNPVAVESTTRHTVSEIQKANNIQISNIEKIIFESFGTSTEIELSDEVLKDLEKSKTAVSPILDELSVSKLGNIYIIENDEKKLFGDIFSDITGTYYLHCIGNPNNAVVELSLKSNN